MSFGLQVYNNGNEILYTKPATYILMTVQINPSATTHTGSYTVNLSSPLPTGTSLKATRVLDGELQTVDYVLDNTGSGSQETTFVTDISLNAARNQVIITTVYGNTPPVWNFYEGKMIIYSTRGSL